jgi:hypothetical protein
MSAPVGQYAVNYFPVDNGGYQMWRSYNGSQYQADMEMAKILGFNTMRVILAAKSGYFDFSTPPTVQLANLRDFYTRAKKVGIALHLTLFDYWSSYGLISGSRTWVTAVLGVLPDTANIAVIEIQNETRYASTSIYTGGFDSGWPSGTIEYNTVGPAAIVWAQEMTRYIRSITSDVAVTSSCSYGTADLTAYAAVVKNTSAAPDWYDWHCYTGSSSLVHSALQTAIGIVGDPAMLYIGETGLTSTPFRTQGTLQAHQAQSDYIQTVRWSCERLGLPEPSPWILFDMNSSAQFSDGQTFGLFDTSGKAKISGKMYQAVPPGSSIPAVGLNGNMQGNHPDRNGNALPARWMLYRGQTGRQPITSAIDSATTYEDDPTVILTGSRHTSDADNPPALESRPCTWPVVSAGQSYTFSCALKAIGAYGSGVSPSLQISWYDSSENYISSGNKCVLALTSSFKRYSISGSAPRAAAYARLFVRVGYNAGKIWVGGATWS